MVLVVIQENCLVINKAKERKRLTEKYWSPLDFEEVANSIDQEDNDLSGDNDEKLKEYRKLGKPYRISAGLEGGVKFIFTMSPLMATVAANSEFIQTDITYDYPYIFNAVAFNCTSMEWMVIGRVRFGKAEQRSLLSCIQKDT